MIKMLNSFKYALSGIKKAFLSGRNFRIMAVCFLLVISFGFIFSATLTEWTILLLCCGMVLSAEMINTSLETAVDIATQENSRTAGKAKDIAAGASLIASIISAVIALIIFIPHIIEAVS